MRWSSAPSALSRQSYVAEPPAQTSTSGNTVILCQHLTCGLGDTLEPQKQSSLRCLHATTRQLPAAAPPFHRERAAGRGG
jgi:hypothetical protein